LQVYDWQVIVEEHGPVVWQTAQRLLANEADAADCFQEAFAAAYEISRGQRVRNVCGLLVHLATTRAIDKLRERNRRQQRQTKTVNRTNTAESDPAACAETQELAGQLRDAIGRLPAQEAKVFCLRYMNGMSYRQIAKELGIKSNATGVLLHRARAKLRDALTHAHATVNEVSG
jgi:RNA polymerase sigma-70 factor (ECF subfamily)